MKQPILMSHGVSNTEFIRLAQSAAEGVVFPSGKIIVASLISSKDPQKKVLMQYSADFQKAYGKPASHFGGHAWDAFQLVVSAIKAVGPERVKIRNHIESRKNFVGIGGVFNMGAKDHNGLDKDAFAMIAVKNGKWTLAK
jgi:branched-chain amino acid transport system substrate-binding protein